MKNKLHADLVDEHSGDGGHCSSSYTRDGYISIYFHADDRIAIYVVTTAAADTVPIVLYRLRTAELCRW